MENIAILKSFSTAEQIELKQAFDDLKGKKRLTKRQITLIDAFDKKKQEIEKSPESFKNPFQAGKYLQSEGYKITPKTFDTHVKKGKILPDLGEKGFSKKALDDYGKFKLFDRVTRQNTKNKNLADKAHETRIRTDEAKARLIEFELDRKMGKYILKEDFYREMAARAATLDTDYEGMIQTTAPELVKLVNGDRKKTGELIHKLQTEFNRMLNEFTTTKEFKVIFEVMDNDGGTGA